MTLSMTHLRLMAFALALPAFAVSLWIATTWPIEPIMPSYLDIAEKLRSVRIPKSFEPIGYPFLISGWLFDSVEATLRFVHLASFWVLIAMALLLAWTEARPGKFRHDAVPVAHAALFALCLAVTFYTPYFLLGLVRVSDNGVNIAFCAVLFLCAMRGAERPFAIVLVAPILLALFVVVRPNAITLLPLAIGLVLWHRLGTSRALLAAAVFVVAFVAFSIAISGTLAFWPSNGGYNLFAGNNPFARDMLATNYNAEYSLDAALKWCGVEGDRYVVADRDHAACARKFVSERPLEAFQLAAYKVYTLMFRPNLKLADTGMKTAFQVLIVLPGIVWWLAVLLVRRFRSAGPVRIAVVMAILYAAPFVVANADPRFRIPLDVFYALSTLAFLARDARGRYAEED